jgi:hypothetical protein
MVEEFEQTALDLNVGEISGIVESLYGYHIIMRTPLDPEEYRATYVAACVDNLASDWLKETPVETNDTYKGFDAVVLLERMFALQEAIYNVVYPAEEQPEAQPEAQG